MITAIDTNILIDVLNQDEKHFDASKRLLDEALAQGALIISEIVYAELATQFEDKSKLDHFLEDAEIKLKPSTKEALGEASEDSRFRSGNIALRCENKVFALHNVSRFTLGGLKFSLNEVIYRNR